MHIVVRRYQSNSLTLNGVTVFKIHSALILAEESRTLKWNQLPPCCFYPLRYSCTSVRQQYSRLSNTIGEYMASRSGCASTMITGKLLLLVVARLYTIASHPNVPRTFKSSGAEPAQSGQTLHSIKDHWNCYSLKLSYRTCLDFRSLSSNRDMAVQDSRSQPRHNPPQLQTNLIFTSSSPLYIYPSSQHLLH